MIVASFSPLGKGAQWSNAAGTGKSSGPVLIAGVGVGRTVGVGLPSVGVSVSVMVCDVGVIVASGEASVGECVAVSCGDKVDEISAVTTGDVVRGAVVGALQARVLATHPRMISHICLFFFFVSLILLSRLPAFRVLA